MKNATFRHLGNQRRDWPDIRYGSFDVGYLFSERVIESFVTSGFTGFEYNRVIPEPGEPVLNCPKYYHVKALGKIQIDYNIALAGAEMKLCGVCNGYLKSNSVPLWESSGKLIARFLPETWSGDDFVSIPGVCIFAVSARVVDVIRESKWTNFAISETLPCIKSRFFPEDVGSNWYEACIEKQKQHVLSISGTMMTNGNETHSK